VLAAPLAGFFGKLPARGDFVCLRLPRAFTAPWDSWVASMLAGSRDALGPGWLDAWLEAPVWRFALPAGLCGPLAALGLMLPSVDRAGRYFPLTFAALFADTAADGGNDGDPAWLGRCEAAGRAALDEDADPERVLAMMGPPPRLAPPPAAGSCWWTDGGPFVPAGRTHCPGMPDMAAFLAMLAGAGRAGASAGGAPS
jgi:type VI secretion system protein ImpM